MLDPPGHALRASLPLRSCQVGLRRRVGPEGGQWPGGTVNDIALRIGEEGQQGVLIRRVGVQIHRHRNYRRTAREGLAEGVFIGHIAGAVNIFDEQFAIS